MFRFLRHGAPTTPVTLPVVVVLLALPLSSCQATDLGEDAGADQTESAGTLATGTSGASSVSVGSWSDGPSASGASMSSGWATSLDPNDDGPAVSDTSWSDTDWSDTDWGGTDWSGTSGSDGGGSGTSGGPDCVGLDLGSAMGIEVLAGTIGLENATETLGCNPDPGLATDIVLVWTPPVIGDYTIRVQSLDFDPVVAIRSADCDAPVFGCNDNCVGSSSALVLSGWDEPVHIIVESGSGVGGAFSLAIEWGASLSCG